MNQSSINWHSVRTTALIIITMVVNVLAIFHNTVTQHTAEVFDTITPVLLYIEHLLAGNSAAPSEPNPSA